MAAPEPFAEMPDFSLAPRAPSIHDPSIAPEGRSGRPRENPQSSEPIASDIPELRHLRSRLKLARRDLRRCIAFFSLWVVLKAGIHARSISCPALRGGGAEPATLFLSLQAAALWLTKTPTVESRSGSSAARFISFASGTSGTHASVHHGDHLDFDQLLRLAQF